MAQATCSIDGCDAPVRARGWCISHYSRWRRTGDVGEAVPFRPVGRLTPEERFWSKVDKNAPGGCWLWTAGQNGHGYGHFHFKGKGMGAHRIAYELLVGPIPEGLTLDHLCRVTTCVNPEHLEAVTNKENILRGTSPSASHARKTHCPKGHEYTPENTYVTKSNSRECRICVRARNRAAYRKRQANR